MKKLIAMALLALALGAGMVATGTIGQSFASSGQAPQCGKC
jgi:hypothetical protein